jgi:hypothetical protein
MKTTLNPLTHYAIIEAMCTETTPERFVIAYGSEQSLRQVIADDCILASGFLSRQDATESCASCLTLAA